MEPGLGKIYSLPREFFFSLENIKKIASFVVRPFGNGPNGDSSELPHPFDQMAL